MSVFIKHIQRNTLLFISIANSLRLVRRLLELAESALICRNLNVGILGLWCDSQVLAIKPSNLPNLSPKSLICISDEVGSW